MWEIKEGLRSGREGEELCDELSESDPALKKRESRERMADVAIKQAKARGLTFKETDEELKAAVLAYIDERVKDW